MHRVGFGLVVGLSAALLAACTSSGATSTPGGTGSLLPAPLPTAPAASTAPVSQAPSAEPSAEPSLPTAAATALDPCVLVPADVASQLAGVTFAAGVEKTFNGVKQCDYGDNTKNVFHVVLGVAPDQATANSVVTEAMASLTKSDPGLHWIQVLTLGDGAAYATFTSAIIDGSALYGRKGLTFYGFSDLANVPTMTADQLQTEAQAILAQLP
jgi:Protein of unknown function (DUF3558)